MSSDSYICNLCHLKVKTKLKRAHESSAKHRENVRKLSAPKRPAAVENAVISEEPVLAKRPRPDNVSIEQHSVALRKEEKIEVDESSSGLPDNFFDSTAKAKAAAASVEMDKELSKFMNEVSRMEQREEEIDDKEDALRNDLEMIDEQIEMWKNLNELEKQKEQLVADIHAKATTNEANDGNLSDDGDKSMDDSDEEFDAYGLDWRARKI